MINLRPRLASLLTATVCALATLYALRALEAHWPPLALWAFVLLSLTLGFGHGALDALLLVAQMASRSKIWAVSALYLLCVLLAGWALSRSAPLAIALLVLMSVWHFGEQYAEALWVRLCVGGASVMWPMLVARDDTSQLPLGTLGARFETALLAWHMFAKFWLILLLGCAIAFAVRLLKSRKNVCESRSDVSTSSRLQMVFAISEILILLFAYLVVSPLLAFAIYFGAYHCVAHIARVRRAMMARRVFAFTSYLLVFTASALLTAVLLALLWWVLPPIQGLGADQALKNIGQILQWIIVGLAAVTLPHLVLVSFSSRWLGN